jgi:hypothetical protein
MIKMTTTDCVLVRSVRKVQGGYIVEARYPYGNTSPYGEVICRDLQEVFALIERCDPDKPL